MLRRFRCSPNRTAPASTSVAASPKRPLALSTNCEAPCKAHSGAKALLVRLSFDTCHGPLLFSPMSTETLRRLKTRENNHNRQSCHKQNWWYRSDLTVLNSFHHLHKSIHIYIYTVHQESHHCAVIAARSWSSDIQGQAAAGERICLPSWLAEPPNNDWWRQTLYSSWFSNVFRCGCGLDSRFQSHFLLEARPCKPWQVWFFAFFFQNKKDDSSQPNKWQNGTTLASISAEIRAGRASSGKRAKESRQIFVASCAKAKCNFSAHYCATASFNTDENRFQMPFIGYVWTQSQ